MSQIVKSEMVSLTDAKKIIENDFRSIGRNGYLVVDAKVLRAQVYGVPQTRERIIFIGFKKDALTKVALDHLTKLSDESLFNPYPQPTHGESESSENLLPYVKVKDAFIGLKEPKESKDPSHQAYSKAKWYGKHCQGQTEVNLKGLGHNQGSESSHFQPPCGFKHN